MIIFTDKALIVSLGYKMSLVNITIILFVIMNSFGHITKLNSLLQGIDSSKRRTILLREMFIALIIMIVFNFLGDFLMLWLGVNQATVQIAGGVILFLIALRMVFPIGSSTFIPINIDNPFIIPIATPMIAGPSILATIMIFTHENKLQFWILLAIIIAWFLSSIILFAAQHIEKVLGHKILVAFERLMGLVLTLLAVESLLKGIKIFITNNL